MKKSVFVHFAPYLSLVLGDFIFLKRYFLNNIIFITTKNTPNIISVFMGALGANVAINIMGNPNAIAGKF